MEFKECLLSRKSIRKFTNEKISDKTIKEIITAGIYAPSACNFEAWKFIVVKKDTKNREILDNPVAVNAPYGILVTYRNDIYVSGRVYNDYYQSAAASIENMLLYITSLGLGGVWICGLPKPKVLKKSFNIPKNFDVVGYIAFGHYNKDDENSLKDAVYHYGSEEALKLRKRRFTLEQVICNDSFYEVENDSTNYKYPTKKEFKKRKRDNKFKALLRKLHLKK